MNKFFKQQPMRKQRPVQVVVPMHRFAPRGFDISKPTDGY